MRSDNQSARFFLPALIVLSFLLRHCYYYEPVYFHFAYQSQFISQALEIIRDLDFEVPFRRHGPLYFYLLAACFWAALKIVRPGMVWAGEIDVEMENFLLFRIAKDISILFSLANILLIYGIARRLFHKKEVAVWAGFLYAICPLDIALNHLGYPESLLTFWVLLAGWSAVRISETGYLRYYLAAGAASGLAVGTRYTFPVVVLPLAAHFVWFRIRPGIPGKLFHPKLVLAGIASAAAFFLSAPFLVLDPGETLQRVRCLLTSVHYYDSVQPWYYVRPFREFLLLLPVAFGPGVYIGAIWGFFRMPRVAMVLLAVFPVAFSVIGVAVFPNAIYAHFLPALPFLLIAAGFLMVSLWEAPGRSRRAAGWAVCLVSLFFYASDPVLPLYRSIGTSAEELGRWIDAHVEDPHEAGLIEHRYFLLWPTGLVTGKVTYYEGIHGLSEDIIVMANPTYLIVPDIGDVFEGEQEVLAGFRAGRYRYEPAEVFQPGSYYTFIRKISLPQEAEFKLVVYRATEKYRPEEKAGYVREALRSRRNARSKIMTVFGYMDRGEVDRVLEELGPAEKKLLGLAPEE